METLPAHDSPNNILNTLNDFCIQEILRRLESVDFFNASMTCKRLHENAKMCFLIVFQPDTFIRIEKPTKVDDVQYILNMFGHSIKKLRWIASGDRKIDSKIFEVIANASSPRITCLRICVFRILIECWNEPTGIRTFGYRRIRTIFDQRLSTIFIFGQTI